MILLQESICAVLLFWFVRTSDALFIKKGPKILKNHTNALLE